MEHLKDKFKEKFNISPTKTYFSPGRVNLIGEHIDYNGGHVMPFSISLGISAALSFTFDKTVNLVSSSFNDLGILSFNLDNFEKENNFSDYVKGIIFILKEDYHINLPYGFNIYIESTLPKSSGLSSSAALEVLVANILNDEFKLGFSKIELALISQKAENRYVNVNCGIMDQFAVSLGLEDNAILLNTNTLDYEYIPFELKDSKLIIVNTNKPRNLVESKYNERRLECDEALKLIKKDTLCNASLDDIVNLPETLKKRARHAITEELRVKDACVSLKEGNIINLGNLLKESHYSLRYDYEVTGLELDTIVDILNESKLCLGARMTGAGFGGCIVSIFKDIDDSKLEIFMEEVNKKYFEITNLNLSYYILNPANGTKEI